MPRVRRIDTAKAEAAPGVVGVFTAADVPNNIYGLNVPDQPVLCGPGAPEGMPDADIVRFVGDQVAVAVAETEAQAAAALGLIEIDWEDLPVVNDPLEARQPDSPLVHAYRDSNVLLEYHIRRGDLDAAFAQADVIVEHTYRTGAQEHAYLQPEAGVATVDELGRIVVEVAGQWAHKDREQIATSLRLPQEQVVVRYPAIGGAFGGREDMSVQIILALAAWRLHQRGMLAGRSIKTIWSRREFDHRPPQAPSDGGPRQMGRDSGRQAGGPADGFHQRLRRLRLHLDQGAGQRHAGLPGAVRVPQPVGGCAHRLHEQRPQRRVPRLRRAAGPLHRRNADEQAGRGAGHGPGRAAPAQLSGTRAPSRPPAASCPRASPSSRCWSG